MIENNIDIIKKFLSNDDNNIVFICNINESVSIFYKMLIKKLSKNLYKDLLFVSKISDLLKKENVSLFDNKELCVCEISGNKLSSDDLFAIAKNKKVFLFVSYGFFKKEARKFLSINSYDYKKDIDLYFNSEFNIENRPNSSKRDFLYHCYNNPHLFFSEFDKYELNQDINKENKIGYKDSIFSIRQALYKIKNNFTLKSLPLFYKTIKDEVKFKKFDY